MSESINVDESLIQRLPLPLAKLVRRAQNAKTPLDRHQVSFYDRMARALLGAMTQLLEQLDVLAGRRLIYVGDVRRQSAGDWLVERYELIGESARPSSRPPSGRSATSSS